MCLIFKNVNFILKVVVFSAYALVLARTSNGLDRLKGSRNSCDLILIIKVHRV